MRDRVALIRRPWTPRGATRRRWLAATAILSVLPSFARAADLPPEVVAEFTRRVQPLVINRCAAGACHGGPESPAPRFLRRDPRGGIDRRGTLANMQALLDASGPEREATKLATLLASRHPVSARSQVLVAAPLTPRERATLDEWLAAVRAAEQRAPNSPIPDPAVRQVSAEEPLPREPNRFKALLDAAANPPRLPPPQEPQGVIFPKDVLPAE